jgi:hypothetical protein
VYDVPVKAADKERLDESEEVYRYLIAAIAPTDSEQIPQHPDAGFLYPAFTDRSTDMAHVNIYQRNGTKDNSLPEILGLQL